MYRAACKLSAIDKEVAETERAFLLRLKGALFLDEAVAKKIEDGAGL